MGYIPNERNVQQKRDIFVNNVYELDARLYSPNIYRILENSNDFNNSSLCKTEESYPCAPD